MERLTEIQRNEQRTSRSERQRREKQRSQNAQGVRGKDSVRRPAQREGVCAPVTRYALPAKNEQRTAHFRESKRGVLIRAIALCKRIGFCRFVLAAWALS